MTVITDRRDQSPGPIKDPGTGRVHKSDKALFYTGLVAATALLAFGTMSVMAVLPMIIPGYTSASITSGSMMPTFRIGDVVIAADRGVDDIGPGTIVVYENRDHDLVKSGAGRTESLSPGDISTGSGPSIPTT